MTSFSTLPVDYFDGHTARAHRVQMWIDQGMLQLSGRDLIRQVPLKEVRWPERTRHGMRLAHFSNGGSVQALDSTRWDAWCREHQLGESLVVLAQQSWRWSMVAATLLILVTVMGYWWGLPFAARALVPLIPVSLDKQVGSATLEAMEAQWLTPSKLPTTEQLRLRALFIHAFDRHAETARTQPLDKFTRAPALPAVPLQWHFRQARIGPNAFALPDGSIVVTDDLIALLQDREDVLLGVLGHELGHIALRHGMRTLIQTGLLGGGGQRGAGRLQQRSGRGARTARPSGLFT
jgi:Zn-dependent protease with chaperone function